MEPGDKFIKFHADLDRHAVWLLESHYPDTNQQAWLVLHTYLGKPTKAVLYPSYSQAEGAYVKAATQLEIDVRGLA